MNTKTLKYFYKLAMLCSCLVCIKSTSAQNLSTTDLLNNFDSSFYKEYTKVIPTNDSGYIIIGRCVIKKYNDSTRQSEGDILVIKLNANGEATWHKKFGGDDEDFASDIKQTHDGGYIIIGTSSSNNGDVTNNKGYSDVWILKLSNNGNLLWQKSYGTASRDEGCSIELTQDGGYIFLASINQYDATLKSYIHPRDLWVVKISANGSKQWQKRFGDKKDDLAQKIIATPDSGYLVAATNYPNPVNKKLGKGLQDVWLFKLDKSGNMLWQKKYGGSNDDEIYNIKILKTGEIVFVGETSSADGDLYRKKISTYNSYAWVVKLSSSGKIIWSNAYRGINWSRASSIISINAGGLLVVGTATPYGKNGYTDQDDIWTFKIDDNGNLIWFEFFLGDDADENPAYAFQDKNGSYVVVGFSNFCVDKHMGVGCKPVKLKKYTITTEPEPLDKK